MKGIPTIRTALGPLIAAAAAIATPAGAQAPSAPRADAPWRTLINVCRRDAAPAAAEHQQPREERTSCADRMLERLIFPGDVPANLRNRSFAGRTEIELLIGEDGKASACRILSPSSEPRLDAIVCPKIQERGSFRPFYIAPGRPVTTRWTATVFWWFTNEPPMPTMVPFVAVSPPFDPSNPRLRTWPRLFWGGGIEPASLPRIQGDFPRAARRDGTVSLDLVVTQEDGIRDCVIGVSSGDSALDAASCAAARRVDLVYSRPCETCPGANVPLQIVWRRRGGSHVRFPLPWTTLMGDRTPIRDPADTRTATTYLPGPRPERFLPTPDDYRSIADRTMQRQSLSATVGVNADGRVTSCRTQRSTGNVEIDRRTCALIVDKARFRPRTDVFGDPVATETGITIDLSGIG